MSGTRLPWDGFSSWVEAICVVTFDLELGQALELVYPGHARLSEVEKANICYLAFPDSNSGCMGDTVFHFRARRHHAAPHKAAHKAYNRTCPNALSVEFGYFYGFVYFRQVSDKTIPRGYFQKSVVLLSQLPLFRLFREVITSIAPEYFLNGEAGLETACHDVDQWAAPVPGRALSLPLMGRVVHTRIPSRFDSPNVALAAHPAASAEPGAVLLPSVHELTLYDSLCPFLPHLQLLWELVLLGEPLAVLAPSPTTCSNLVQALVSLLWPLQYAQDYRPFFTIHDSEFKEYTSRTQAPPNVILGVTNPFFCKTLQHWPHILRLVEPNDGSPKSGKMKKGGDLRTIDSKPGVYTQYKSYLAKDKHLLKRLQKGAESMRPGEVQSVIIRRHFMELTQSFMIPLERYVASLMPLAKQISPWKAAPCPRRFDVDAFLATLDAHGPQLTSGLRGDWAGLYRAFLPTPNARAWLTGRLSEVSEKLELLHLEVVCSATLDAATLASREELELVDLLLKLRDKAAFLAASDAAAPAHFKDKLQAQTDAVLNALSPDLRASLLMAAQHRPPTHAALRPPSPHSPAHSVS